MFWMADRRKGGKYHVPTYMMNQDQKIQDHEKEKKSLVWRFCFCFYNLLFEIRRDSKLEYSSFTMDIGVFTVPFNPNGDWYTVFSTYKELKSKISDQSDQK